MQLKLNFLEPVGDILVVDAFDVDRPSMGVFSVDSWRSMVRVNGFGDTSED